MRTLREHDGFDYRGNTRGRVAFVRGCEPPRVAGPEVRGASWLPETPEVAGGVFGDASPVVGTRPPFAATLESSCPKIMPLSASYTLLVHQVAASAYDAPTR